MDGELGRLQGVWQAIRVATAAGPVPDEVARRLRYAFTGDRVTLFEGGRASGTGGVVVDPAATPKAITVTMSDGPGAGQVARGVYEIVGERLRLCVGPDRPAGFTAVGPASVVELERIADERTVAAGHRDRVAAYAAQLPDIAALQAHGQHAFVAACLGALARRRVADHMDGRRTLGEVAAAARVDHLALRRLVRFLEPHGVFDLTDDRAALTAKGRLLRSDSPVWSSLVLRGANDAASHLDHSLGTGEAAFPRAFGAGFWSFLAAHPAEQDAFADAMRLQSAMLSIACVPAMDLSAVAAIADVGGGTGDLLAAILEAHPGVRGILVDRPEMLARAHPALRAGPLAARVTLRPGDLFSDFPAADAYVLAQVLHDWDDDDAARILQGLRRAAPPGARVFVLTLLIPEGGGAHPAKTADVGMMALFGGGRERTEAELRDLLASAGWRTTAVTPTRVAAVIVATRAEPDASSDPGRGT